MERVRADCQRTALGVKAAEYPLLSLAYRMIVPPSSLQPFLVQAANLTLPQGTEGEIRF